MTSNLLSIILNSADNLQEQEIARDVVALNADIRATAQRGDRTLVRNAEELIRKNPSEYFSLDSSDCAILEIDGTRWKAGRFETLSIGDLKELAASMKKSSSGRARLWLFDGASPATDIGALQATCTNTLFQVASQFNCLESQGPHVSAVMSYFDDPTQGPRAAVSAFPATLQRHYRAPNGDGTFFTQQTNGNQIDLLADVWKGAVRNGYLTGQGIDDPEPMVAAFEENFDRIRVGVHDEAEVVLGYNWDGSVAKERLISQVFASTVAGGGYGGHITLGQSNFIRLIRQLLGAAYLGTLLSAVCLDRDRVVLTLIGGGVFKNPIREIWNAIEWALDEVAPFLNKDLEVFINGYNISRQISLDEILPSLHVREGRIIRLGDQFSIL